MVANRRHLKVLVIDDEPGILALFQFLLSAVDCTVLTAQEEQEGLALAAAHECQVGFLDLHLNRHTRLDLVRQLRHLRPEMTVVPMICYDSEELDREVDALGVPCIRKPFEISEVLTIIDERARV